MPSLLIGFPPGGLLDTVSRCHAQTLRGMKWTLTRLKTAAPQVLENDFVGAPTGILDQSASLLCTAGSALFLDTRERRTEQAHQTWERILSGRNQWPAFGYLAAEGELARAAVR